MTKLFSCKLKKASVVVINARLWTIAMNITDLEDALYLPLITQFLKDCQSVFLWLGTISKNKENNYMLNHTNKVNFICVQP